MYVCVHHTHYYVVLLLRKLQQDQSTYFLKKIEAVSTE